ncbi:G5 domain-containing protein [Acidaminobacterium chupaoyuni]
MNQTKHNGRLAPLCAMLTATFLLLTLMLTSVNTVAVYDGSDMKLVNTLSSKPADAVALAGIELSAKDEMVVTDDLSDGLGKIQINRAFPVSITADGSTMMLQTTGDTVANILAEAGITLSETDMVSPAADAMVRSGSDITVRRITIINEKVASEIPFETVKSNTNELKKGTSRVVTAGQNGQKVTTYRVEYHDGVEASRTEVSSEVTAQPVNEVVQIGTGGVVSYNGNEYSYSRVLNMRATAYTTEGKSWKRTASGTTARVGAVAVDRNVIPLGSKLLIRGSNGGWYYGVAVAEDTGVKGNTIDLFYNTYRECVNFGVRGATVYVLD